MKRAPFLWLSPTLTAIGKKLGIDAHYFAKNSFFVLVGHAVSILRGVITGYLVTLFFQKEIYGQYQFILSVMGMLGIFSLSGLNTAVTRAWSRGDAFSMRSITRHQLVVNLLGSLALLGCIPFLGRYGREELWPLFVVGAAVFPLSAVAMTRFGAYTVGKARFDLSLTVSLVWSALVMAATLAIIFLYQSAALLLLANAAIPPLVYLWASRSFREPTGAGTEKNTKAIIRYGWHITFSTLPADAVWYVDKLLISHFLGLGELATFSVALLLPEQVKVLIKQFFPVTFAKQAERGDSRERRAKLMKATLIGMLVFAVGIGLYIAASPFLIPFLFPQYDADQVILLTGIAALTLITQPITLIAQYLEAQRMVREIWLSNFVSAILFGIALVTLIPLYGLLGAIIARGVFRFAYSGACWIFMLRAPVREE